MPGNIRSPPVTLIKTMNESKPKEIGEVAGCLVDKEREFLLDYASRLYTGGGEIVDLGCFLGSSTYALAAGLDDNSQVTDKDKRIHAYDRFEWNPWMDRPAERYTLARTYQENECFADEFERQMGDKIRFIKTVKGDLTKLTWQSEKAIEYLFIDSMKDWQLCNCIIPGYYPAMTPGVSYLHHQDFVFFHTYWIHLTMYRMRDYFESVDHNFMGPSKVFRYLKQLPNELMNARYSIDQFSVDEINAAFEYSIDVVRPRGHSQIVGAKILALLEKQEAELANELLERAATTHPDLTENPVFQKSVSNLQNKKRQVA